ncbi:helix-turn-helix domain-containing protein [Thiotrichales bacterium 19X7-9]|nr:helix-turn-helix domain-containing protein [Thiotrichales bacterium 19X7-9]
MSSTVVSNIIQILEDRELSVKEVAVKSGISLTGIKKILSCNANVKFNTVTKIANALGISPSDLLGINFDKLGLSKNDLRGNIRKIMDAHHMGVSYLSDIVGISPQGLDKYLKGENFDIGSQYLINIASFFDISIEFLINGYDSQVDYPIIENYEVKLEKYEKFYIYINSETKNYELMPQSKILVDTLIKPVFGDYVVAWNNKKELEYGKLSKSHLLFSKPNFKMIDLKQLVIIGKIERIVL